MSNPSPIYLESNLRAAFQLNFSLSCFSRVPLPESSEWIETLKAQCKKDGVKILENHPVDPTVHQFFLSTLPSVAPPAAIRSIKGRLQNLLSGIAPKVFHRNYRIETVGEVNQPTLFHYIGKQPERHPMADPRVQARMKRVQYLDEQVDLTPIQGSSHGQFLYNLHFVFQNRERLIDVRENILNRNREMIVEGLRKRDCHVARIGFAPNHVHILAACALEESPLDLVLSLMNNLAYVQGMKPVLDFSFYVGSFGNYDRDAIRRIIEGEGC